MLNAVNAVYGTKVEWRLNSKPSLCYRILTVSINLWFWWKAIKNIKQLLSYSSAISSLTTAGHTFIWVGREEDGARWAVATLQLHICHGTELIDSVDEFVVVPAETVYTVWRPYLVVLYKLNHEWIKTHWLCWAATIWWWIAVPGITGRLHQRATGLIHLGTWTFIFC